MDPSDPEPDPGSLIQQMRRLSCSTTKTTSPSTTLQSSSTAPLSPRALRRPQRPRATPSSTRPKSMISTSPYQRPSRKQSLDKDDMEIDLISPTTTSFIESLVQEINNTPTSPSFPAIDSPATDLPRQWQLSVSGPVKRWSGTSTLPWDCHVHDEVVTPEQETMAIARYRRERLSLPEHEWWKLDSKHRVAMAALRRMEDEGSMHLKQDASLGQDYPESSFPRQIGTAGVLPGLKPVVLEALAFGHTPNPEAVKPVGENGLDLDNSTQVPFSLVQPPQCNSEAWENWQHREGITDLQRHAYFGARLSAYNFEKGDVFDLRRTCVQGRLRKVEESWQRGRPAMNIETQFWNAVFERENQTDAFAHRDAYLLQANAVEFAAKIFILGLSESEIHEQIFNRYLLTAFDCSEEDREGSNVNIPELADALLNLDSFSRNAHGVLAQNQNSLHEATKRLGQLRFN